MTTRGRLLFGGLCGLTSRASMAASLRKRIEHYWCYITCLVRRWRRSPHREVREGQPGQRGLLVIDNLGYLSHDARAAELFSQVVKRRYERKSLVLTTNLAFADWPTIFPNAGSAIALIARLIHHAESITIEGESYRRRAATDDDWLRHAMM